LLYVYFNECHGCDHGVACNNYLYIYTIQSVPF
jgi:hypothetical protein